MIARLGVPTNSAFCGIKSRHICDGKMFSEDSLSPHSGLGNGDRDPMACAVGYFLPPLRGCVRTPRKRFGGAEEGESATIE